MTATAALLIPTAAGRTTNASVDTTSVFGADSAGQPSFATVLAGTSAASTTSTNAASSQSDSSQTGVQASTQISALVDGTEGEAGTEAVSAEPDAADISSDPSQAVAVGVTVATTASTKKLTVGTEPTIDAEGGDASITDGEGGEQVGPVAAAATPAAAGASTATTNTAAASPGTLAATTNAAEATSAAADGAEPVIASDLAETGAGAAPSSAGSDKPSKASATVSTASPANSTTTAQATSAAAPQADAAVDPATTSQGKATATVDAANVATATTTSSHEAGRASATNTTAQAAAPAATVQVYTRMIERFDGRAQRFEVRLDPAELGRVDVRIEVGADKKVHAVLAAHDSAALNDLMRGQRALERALADAGIDLADGGVKFELANSPGRDSSARDSDGRSPPAANVWRSFEASTPTLDAATPTIAQPWRPTRLDLVA